MCSRLLHIHSAFHSWDLEMRASCPCSSHPAVGPMSSKMVGKDEGHELGFSSLCQNNFSFQGTVLLDMGWMHCAKAMGAGDASL